MKKIIALTVLLFSHWAYGDDELGAYLGAAYALREQIEQKATAGGVPRLSDAKTAHLFSILSDHKRFLQNRKYALKDLADLRLICEENAIRFPIYYMVVGLSDIHEDEMEPQQAVEAFQALTYKNSIVYQDEIMALMPFSVYCSARVVQLASEAISSLKKEEITEIRLQGIRQTKAGFFNIYEGSLRALKQEGIKNEHKMRLAQVLAETVEQFLPFISLSDRVKIIALVKQAQETSTPDVRGQLDKVISTLSSKECGWACQLKM